MAITKKSNIIQLLWSEKDSMVVVEPQDQDRYCLKVEDAIEACRIYQKENRALFHSQLQDTLNRLGQWARNHRGKLQKVFLTTRDAGLLFLLVTKRKTFDEDLETSLTKLDLEIAQDKKFSEIRLSVQALPNCDENNYSSFFNPQWILQFKGING